jgi:hypothetical protein
MPTFTGQLNPNKIFAALFNMIISQQIFSDNLGKTNRLVDRAKEDGTLYGDTKLYYSTDVLASYPWGADSEAGQLLQTYRPKAPKIQGITLNVFRQIPLTTDNYLSKQAWADAYSFSQFNSVMLGWLGDTKKVYEGTTYDAFIGTAHGTTSAQNLELDLTTITSGLTGIEKRQMEGLEIGDFLANLMVDMGDYLRKYNDYGHLRSYNMDQIDVIWNSKYLNKIQKVQLPTIFHKDDVVAKINNDYLTPRFFGTIITSTNIGTYSAATPTTGKPINSGTGAYTPGTNNANGTVRTLEEVQVTVSGTAYHLFAGDEIPTGATVKASGDFEPGSVYIEDANVMCKVLVKLPPYMSAFSVETSFFNAKALNENHFLTFGHNKLEYLQNYPLITISVK